MTRWGVALVLVSAACDGRGTSAMDAGVDASIDTTIVMDTSTDMSVDRGADVLDAGIDAFDACSSIDAASDPKNCGRCGHDCVGGACASGVCQPFVIAPGSSPAGLASDGVDLFWTEMGTGGVEKCPRTGCGDAGSLHLASDNEPVRIVLDNTNAYWTTYVMSNGAVRRVSKSMPMDAGVAIASSLNYPADIVIDNTYLYFNEGNGRIQRCAFPNCTGLTQIVSTVVEQGLAVDSTSLYWTESYVNVVGCDKSNCQATRRNIALNVNGVLSVAAHATDVYFPASEGGGPGAGKLLTCPANAMNCAPKTLATGLDNPVLVLADQTGVYVAAIGTSANNYTDGKILHCAHMGCGSTPTVLANNCVNIQGLAMDADAVYWSEAGGPVRGAAKP